MLSSRFFEEASQFVSLMGQKQKSAIMLAVDVALVPVSFVLCGLLFATGMAALFAESPLTMLMAVALIMVSAMCVSLVLGLPFIKLNAYEETGILKTSVFSAILGVLSYLVSTSVFQDAIVGQDFIIFTMILLILSVGSRIAMRAGLEWLYHQGQHRQKVLIYGAGRTGMQLASALRADPEIVPVGFVDDNTTIQNITVAGLPVHSGVGLETLLKQSGIKRVVLAMPSVSRPKLARISRRIEKIGCDVSMVPSFSTLVGKGPLADTIQPVQPSEFLNRANVTCDLKGLCDPYADKRVLITGAGGSIGSELCRQVLDCRPSQLVLFDVSEFALFQLVRELEDLAHDAGVSVVPVLGSVTDSDLVKRTFDQHEIDVVLHSAAYKHVKLVEDNVLVGMHNNVIGTKIMAEAAQDAGVELFVQVSTDKAVRPTNVMGASKRLAELVVQDLSVRSEYTRFGIVRFGNVLGSSGSVVPLFEEQIARGGPVTLTHPDVTRYFMTISEAARLVLFAGKETKGGELFVLDMGDPVPIRKLAKQMIAQAGYTVKNRYNPDGDIEIAIVGLTAGEKLHEELNTPDSALAATQHPKIMLASDRGLSEIEVAAAMRALTVALDESSTDAVFKLIERFVGRYVSDALNGDLRRMID